jgi:hypothetical protein
MNKYLKLYGATRYPRPAEIFEHDDFSLLADPDTLRAIANFLLESANELEKLTLVEQDWHRHLRDSWTDWKEEMCDIVVCPPPF